MKSMRRKDREITTPESIALFDRAEYGILSTVGKDGQPYGVPLSFVFKDNAIYFHCAPDGLKLDNIADNARVSFCVVGRTKVLPDQFATEYESAMAFGVASEVHGTEKYNALLWLVEKYCADFIEEGKQYIAQKDRTTKVIKIDIQQISGKARR